MPAALRYDVGLDAENDLPVRTAHVTGLDLIVQRIRRRLQTVSGEWLGDKTIGLPFFEWFQQKPPKVNAIGALIRRAIETTPGVARLDDWSGSFDPSTRALTFSGTIRTTDGDVAMSIQPIGSPRAGNLNPSLRLVIQHRNVAPRG